jgi:hypothetical protein
MPLNVKDTGGGQDFDPVPQGTHAAVCYLVADIGMQPTTYGPKHKVVIGFEIPDQIIEYKDKDGNDVKKPMIINNFYTASLSSKAILTGDLEGWRGRAFTSEELQGFNLFNVLGKPCVITVVHNVVGDKTYANIKSVGQVMKGMEVAPATRQLKYSPDEPQQYDDLPEWIQKKIASAVTEDKPQGQPQAGPNNDFDDDIPFLSYEFKSVV